MSAPPIETARLGMWVFLASEAMLFAGLIGAYLFLRTGKAGFESGAGVLERGLVGANTCVLVLSSVTWTRALRAPDRATLVRWLAVTLLLGTAFLAIQSNEYAGLLSAGHLPRTNIFWACFFVLTGVHGLHVLGGLAALAWTGTRALRGAGRLALELAGLYWHFVDLVWIVLFALLYLSSCSDHGSSGVVLAQPPRSQEVFGSVQPFQLTERGGRQVGMEDLKGHAWAACFVFTRCSGPCPRVTATMKALQGRLDDRAIKLVSVSVDPEYDTPKVLSAYADAVGADRERWWFLTGDEKQTDAWIRQSFWSPVERDANAPVGERVTHRTQIVAVDKAGRVRGFYSGESSEDLGLLCDRLAWLEQE